MKFINIILLIYFIVIKLDLAFGQSGEHVRLLSHVRIPENSSSIWGYTTAEGTELALLGTSEGVRIYDISDPIVPEEKIFIKNNSCSWRELKTSGSFAYVGSECDDGLLIIDLSRPDSISHRNVFKLANSKGDSFDILTSHTLYADEKGYIYLSGARGIGAGFAILDPTLDPWNPVVLYHYEDHYMHEVHVQNDILYGAELYNGAFSIWDIADRTAPRKLSSQRTAFGFTHSVWLEKDRKILYTADEVRGAVVESWDVSDPFDIRKLDQYRVFNPNDPYHIPHNVFHKDSLLYVSWYTEGMRVLDTRKADNLVEVAYFDTHPDKRTGFNGCWSIYPYYRSGVVVASDIQYGMYVLQFEGNGAAWLEGQIKDSITGQNLSKVQIQLTNLSSGKTSVLESNPLGQYKAGSGENGKFEIKLSIEAYLTKTIAIDLYQDSVLELNIEMVPRAKADARFEIVEKEFGLALENAQVLLLNPLVRFEGISNHQAGINCTIPNVYIDQYDALCSKWGYTYQLNQNIDFTGNDTYRFEMEAGYEDHMMSKLGWEFVTEDSMVQWIYGDFSELDPPPSNYPSKDVPEDYGNLALYTDNFEKIEEEYRLHGHLSLVSPVMNLHPFDKIRLSYHAWAYGGWDNSVKETMISFGTDTIKLEDIPLNLGGSFNPRTEIDLDIKDRDRDSVRFIFHLWNDPDSAEFAIAMRAAFDYFKLEGLVLNPVVDNEFDKEIKIWPNPAKDRLNLKNSFETEIRIHVLDLSGKSQLTQFVPAATTTDLDLSDFPVGVHILQYHNEDGSLHGCRKLVKF
ncbi:MAG: choice-of-anchor B family protein [Saprospiraceae bacterium]|nr:choice-of-anchor B family protein [Saprospiraceae bacterium]